MRIILLLFLASSLQAQVQVMLGDNPDPSAVRIDSLYWATATTSNWGPVFPLYRSADLFSWKQEGNVFDTLPSWADYYFWAPEISYDNGKVYIYYTAHKKNASLCVAVASADKPEGPYKDHGPLVCEDAGSIDGFAVRDENGKLFLLWKEDGNSVNMPTPIWASEMSEDRTSLIGEKVELFRNDEPWEGNLVEGVAILRNNGYFYAFYAGAGCCGRGCSYGIGVARAKKLLGPWEKFPGNPLKVPSDKWKCSGHGTPIEKDGKFYLLHHAYDRISDVMTGREVLLTEFEFDAHGWIHFVKNADTLSAAPNGYIENFNDARLSGDWQWSVFSKPVQRVEEGKLSLRNDGANTTSVLAKRVTDSLFTGAVTIFDRNSGAAGGLALIGDDKNYVSCSVRNGLLEITQVKEGRETIINEVKLSINDSIRISFEVSEGRKLSVSYEVTNSAKSESKSRKVATEIDAGYLPPWDRALRIGLMVKGEPEEVARFDNFSYTPGIN